MTNELKEQIEQLISYYEVHSMEDFVKDPETSSKTKGGPGGRRLLNLDKKQTNWFDGYTEQ